MHDWPNIVEQHGPAAFRIARRILGRAADAEDVCQEVFAEVYRMTATGTVENLPGLVRRLASFRALDQLRKRKPTSPLDDSDVIGDRHGPAAVAIANELVLRLRCALTQLPEQQAAAFTLRYFENLSTAEIAKSLGTTTSAVSTALSKSRATLGKTLDVANPGTKTNSGN